MATWSELVEAQPEIGAAGVALLEKHGLAYLATVRADGAPRVHPVCPFIADGRLFVATAATSPKRLDLLRDGRYVLHMLPGKNDDEFRIRGRASLVTDASLRSIAVRGAREARQPDGNGIEVQDSEWLFEYDIEEAATAYWEHVGQPGTYPVRRSWREKRE